MADPDLVLSPLHDRHVALGAKLAAFGGWSMPLEYPSGVVKEHTAVREAVGVFDVSHLGKVMVSGPGAAAYVNATLSNDLGKIAPGKAQYTLCCDEETGGIVDDLIAYWSDDEHVLLVPNAANSAEVARRLGHDYMSFVESEWRDSGTAVVVCRTGYTGERGYELIAHADIAGELWDAILAAGEPHGILPCGLGARDTLRTEMGYPLHGQDITLDVTPVQAGLGWAVGWKKDAFWGKDVLVAEKEAGPRRRLRGLVATGRGIPRPGMGVTLSADVPLCDITSGTFSPTLKKGIGLALVPTMVAPDAEVGVDIRGRREIFRLVKPPFVDTSVRES
jgi:aminomethyltransferase